LPILLDILSGVLTGGRMGTEITDLFTGEAATPQGLGHFLMAINIDAFMPVAEFKQRKEVAFFTSGGGDRARRRVGAAGSSARRD
jgi:LDH2 family malate/lactate/ureidoglycolate dehydrogenase